MTKDEEIEGIALAALQLSKYLFMHFLDRNIIDPTEANEWLEQEIKLNSQGTEPHQAPGSNVRLVFRNNMGIASNVSEIYFDWSAGLFSPTIVSISENNAGLNFSSQAATRPICPMATLFRLRKTPA